MFEIELRSWDSETTSAPQLLISLQPPTSNAFVIVIAAAAVYSTSTNAVANTTFLFTACCRCITVCFLKQNRKKALSQRCTLLLPPLPYPKRVIHQV